MSKPVWIYEVILRVRSIWFCHHSKDIVSICIHPLETIPEQIQFGTKHHYTQNHLNKIKWNICNIFRNSILSYSSFKAFFLFLCSPEAVSNEKIFMFRISMNIYILLLELNLQKTWNSNSIKRSWRNFPRILFLQWCTAYRGWKHHRRGKFRGRRRASNSK